MAEDRISDLPDDILHLIIANLPVLSQVQTSVLSRRWKHMWSLNPSVRLLDWPPLPRQTNPNLGYFNHNLYHEQIHRLFCHILRRSQAPQIIEIQNNFWSYYRRCDRRNLHDPIDDWIDFVISRYMQIPNLRNGPSFARYMKREKSIYVYERRNEKINSEDPGSSVSREDPNGSEIVLGGQDSSLKPSPQKKDEECDAEEEEDWEENEEEIIIDCENSMPAAILRSYYLWEATIGEFGGKRTSKTKHK